MFYLLLTNRTLFIKIKQVEPMIFPKLKELLYILKKLFDRLKNEIIFFIFFVLSIMVLQVVYNPSFIKNFLKDVFFLWKSIFIHYTIFLCLF